ncbi:MAG: RNA polymerase sigma-70 factor [Prolixibacteraceae bacterium]
MKITSNINDQELIRLLGEGSKDAFRLLYSRYGVRIRRFAYFYLRQDQDAEELVQDVFLKLWDKRTMLDGSGNLRAYIYKIAVNSIYDFIRRKNVEQAFLEFSRGSAEESDQTWDDIVYQDMLSHLSRLIEKMPDQRRKIFVMSKEKGLSNDEIAAALKLSKRTVENQLYRATSFLKSNLSLDSIVSVLFFYLFC